MVYDCYTAKVKKRGAGCDEEKWVNLESVENDGENLEFVVLEA